MIKELNRTKNTMPPKKMKRYTGRHALVDNIPYTLPISAKNSPAIMPEGLESIYHLRNGEEWLSPSSIMDYEKYKIIPPS